MIWKGLKLFIKNTEYICMHIECMVSHCVQNKFIQFFYQSADTLPLPSGEKEVPQTPHSNVINLPY